MAECGWIKMFFFLIPLLQITAAEKLLLSFTVRDGDEVTLPCENVIDGQQNCVYTTWLFSDSGRSPAVSLIEHGQIKNTKSKSDRLSVTANCSLVIKKVTVEDVGHYTCRQFISGRQQCEDSLVHLSVINMNEQKDDDKVTLNCSVSSYYQCRYTVKWLYEGKDVDKDNKDLQTSQTGCYTTVSFLTSHHIYTSRLNLFTCEVTNGDTGKVQLFPFRLQSSGEDSIRATTKPTTTSEKIKDATTKSTTTRTTEESTTLKTNNTESANNHTGNMPPEWGWYILVVGLAALLIIVIAVVRCRRTKANKTQMDKLELTSNPAETRSAPETGQDTADPEDDVSYASISYTKKRNSKAKVRRKNDDDEGDAVTYTTVKASSTDPSNLYATIS